MRKDCLLLVREQNIDGCGDFADVLLKLRAPLEPGQKEALQTELTRLKGSMDCPDTDAVVETAMQNILGGAEWLDFDLLEY